MSFALPSDCLPKTRAFFDYWDGKRGDRVMPGRPDLDPVDIPSLLQYIFLIDVAPVSQALRYRVFGTALTELFRRDLTGLAVGAGSRSEHLPRILARYARILETGIPFFGREIMHERTNDFTPVERLILPLSRDGARVDQVIGITIPYDTSAPSSMRALSRGSAA